jgi:hypothetical protein
MPLSDYFKRIYLLGKGRSTNESADYAFFVKGKFLRILEAKK